MNFTSLTPISPNQLNISHARLYNSVGVPDNGFLHFYILDCEGGVYKREKLFYFHKYKLKLE